MIKIEADFKNFDELLAFAQKLAGPRKEGERMDKKESYAVPARPSIQAMPSQQACAAPVQTAPARQYEAPVQPEYAAPAQTQAAPTRPPVQQVPVTAPSYTPDDLARAAMTLMDSGRQQELISLLQSFGVSSLPELKPEQYGPFATALRGMGAQI